MSAPKVKSRNNKIKVPGRADAFHFFFADRYKIAPVATRSPRAPIAGRAPAHDQLAFPPVGPYLAGEVQLCR